MTNQKIYGNHSMPMGLHCRNKAGPKFCFIYVRNSDFEAKVKAIIWRKKSQIWLMIYWKFTKYKFNANSVKSYYVKQGFITELIPFIDEWTILKLLETMNPSNKSGTDGANSKLLKDGLTFSER